MNARFASFLKDSVNKNEADLRKSVDNRQSYMADIPEMKGSKLVVDNEEIIVGGVSQVVHRLYIQTPGATSNVGWVINSSITSCMVCGQAFNYMRWQHHCRACGNLVCHPCSSQKVTIVELKELGEVRVCVQCFWGQDPVHINPSKKNFAYGPSMIGMSMMDSTMRQYLEEEEDEEDTIQESTKSESVPPSLTDSTKTMKLKRTVIPTPIFVIQVVRKLSAKEMMERKGKSFIVAYINVCKHHIISNYPTDIDFVISDDLFYTTAEEILPENEVSSPDDIAEIYHAVVRPQLISEYEALESEQQYTGPADAIVKGFNEKYSFQLSKAVTIRHKEKYIGKEVLEISIPDSTNMRLCGIPPPPRKPLPSTPVRASFTASGKGGEAIMSTIQKVKFDDHTTVVAAPDISFSSPTASSQPRNPAYTDMSTMSQSEPFVPIQDVSVISIQTQNNSAEQKKNDESSQQDDEHIQEIDRLVVQLREEEELQRHREAVKLAQLRKQEQAKADFEAFQAAKQREEELKLKQQQEQEEQQRKKLAEEEQKRVLAEREALNLKKKQQHEADERRRQEEAAKAAKLAEEEQKRVLAEREALNLKKKQQQEADERRRQEEAAKAAKLAEEEAAGLAELQRRKRVEEEKEAARQAELQRLKKEEEEREKARQAEILRVKAEEEAIEAARIAEAQRRQREEEKKEANRQAELRRKRAEEEKEAARLAEQERLRQEAVQRAEAEAAAQRVEEERLAELRRQEEEEYAEKTVRRRSRIMQQAVPIADENDKIAMLMTIAEEAAQEVALRQQGTGERDYRRSVSRRFSAERKEIQELQAAIAAADAEAAQPSQSTIVNNGSLGTEVDAPALAIPSISEKVEEEAPAITTTELTIPAISEEPLPWLVVKTKRSDGGKVFINICHHARVPSMDPEVNIYVKNPKYQEMYSKKYFMSFSLNKARYMMHIGEVREMTDKEGGTCYVNDVIIHSDACLICSQDIELSKTLILKMLKALAMVHQTVYDADFKLPKTLRNYKGQDIQLFQVPSVTMTLTLSPLESSASQRLSTSVPSTPMSPAGVSEKVIPPSTAPATKSSYFPIDRALNEKWKKFLPPGGDVNVVYTSLIIKKNNYGVGQKRQLILTDVPSLLYVDLATNEEKGTIPWDLKNPPKFAAVDKSTFSIEVPGRVYKLTDTENNANTWVEKLSLVARNTKI